MKEPAKDEMGTDLGHGALQPAAVPAAEAPRVVWIRSRGGAGGYSHRYSLDFNAADTLRCEGEAAERALRAIEECPHEYVAAEAPAVTTAKP